MDTFHFVMIKPSHYDEDGYVIQWLRSAMPSNTLATLHGIAADCVDQRVLGDDVELRLSTYDETNTRIRVAKIAKRVRREGGRCLVGLVGVQSNQYPRALDLAREFQAEGLPVCIGGFHVSGCLAMLSEMPSELQEAMDTGVTLFAGEAEGRLGQLLRDANAGELKLLYNHMDDLPSIESVPTPFLMADRVKRTVGRQSSFDAGRGCPFQCSFCTIINVQGRKSRFRSADDVECIIRANLEQGINRFFITDDNFARNKNWEMILDRLIELRECEGLDLGLVLQVDTLCHTIPNFIEKSGKAGVRRVFIGLESINPDSLIGAKKGQNRITEYRKMLQAWRSIRVITTAGYILGFPGDTPESIERDIEIIKREMPLDILEFFFLTPLPGSEDHQKLLERGVQMDPDLNKYDLNHVVTTHDRMSKEDWERAYQLAWDTYYTPEHIETLMRRARASDLSLGKILASTTNYYGSVIVEGVHPLESGVIRCKFRKDRRPGLPLENPLWFYPRYIAGLFVKIFKEARMYFRYVPLRRRLVADPTTAEYIDLSLTPVTNDELDQLEMFTITPSARAAVDRVRR